MIHLYLPMEHFQKTNGVVGRMGRVLLVDDEAAVRGTLRAVLESQGYECDEAEHGSAALTILEQQHFDLIITDNKMPVLNGVEFLKQYSQKPDPKPPVIFFTGDISDEEKELAMKAGARAVLQKPPNFGEIISAVQQAITD